MGIHRSGEGNTGLSVGWEWVGGASSLKRDAREQRRGRSSPRNGAAKRARERAIREALSLRDAM